MRISIAKEFFEMSFEDKVSRLIKKLNIKTWFKVIREKEWISLLVLRMRMKRGRRRTKLRRNREDEEGEDFNIQPTNKNKQYFNTIEIILDC